MTRWSRFALVGITVLVAAGCVMLGLWQGRRLAARRATNQVVLARRDLPELDLTAVSSAELIPLDQRRVTASGTYDHARTIILRNRVERETPGVHVVTPMRIVGLDKAVLVLRGFAPAPDAAVPDSSGFSALGEETVRGIAISLPTDPNGGGLLEFRGITTWGRLDRATLALEIPYPILDAYLQVIPSEEATGRGASTTTFPMPIAVRPLDDGPHLSYMIQWFGIAAVALGFGISVLVRKPTQGAGPRAA